MILLILFILLTLLFIDCGGDGSTSWEFGKDEEIAIDELEIEKDESEEVSIFLLDGIVLLLISFWWDCCCCNNNWRLGDNWRIGGGSSGRCCCCFCNNNWRLGDIWGIGGGPCCCCRKRVGEDKLDINLSGLFWFWFRIGVWGIVGLALLRNLFWCWGYCCRGGRGCEEVEDDKMVYCCWCCCCWRGMDCWNFVLFTTELLASTPALLYTLAFVFTLKLAFEFTLTLLFVVALKLSFVSTLLLFILSL